MGHTDGVSTIYGVPTKYVSLIILVIQNSALVLFMRYSRVLPGPPYLSSTAVVISEILKCLICIFIHLKDKRSQDGYSQLPTVSEDAAMSQSSKYVLREFYSEIFSRKSGFLRLLVPAVLYTLQNNLQFVAATNLDAATFQVTYQCKILTTALFAVIMLRQSLSLLKWISLVILTAGVACVQIPSGSSTTTTQQQGNYFVGILAVAIACICSGFAGVYFEKVLKGGSSSSIWVRNIQLSVGCLAIALTGAVVWDGKAIHQNGFFQGYNPIVVLTICIQAAGGLIVAMVIKYADNILKGFATSLSIVLSTVASVFIFNFVITIYFIFGAMLVFLATYMYSMPEKAKVVEEVQSPKEEVEPPRLVIEDYDSMTEKFSESSSFRDESEVDSALQSPRDEHGDYTYNEGQQRNVSPSLLTKKDEKNDKVVHELGHVQ